MTNIYIIYLILPLGHQNYISRTGWRERVHVCRDTLGRMFESYDVHLFFKVYEAALALYIVYFCPQFESLNFEIKLQV